MGIVLFHLLSPEREQCSIVGRISFSHHSAILSIMACVYTDFTEFFPH